MRSAHHLRPRTRDNEGHPRRAPKLPSRVRNVRLDLHVKPFFRGQRAVDITPPRLRQYAMMRHKQGAANGTINRELSAIRRMFRLAVQDRLLSQIPHFPMLGEEGIREVYITPGEFNAILGNLPAHARGIIRFVWNTGWRITAACKLEWRDLDLEQGYFVLRRENAKNKRAQRLPIVGELQEIFREAEQQRRLDQPCVFHHSQGHVFRRESVWRAFKKASAKAGLPNKTIHDMRRAGARDLIRAGATEDVARKVTGHRTRAVFSRYNITADEDVALAMELLAAYRARQKQEATVTVLSPSDRRKRTGTDGSDTGKSS
jgi:integrase